MATQQQSQRKPVKASRAADILAYVILFVFIGVFVFVGVYRITRHIVWDEPLIPTPTPAPVPTSTTFWQSVTGDISTRVPTSAPTLAPDDALGWARKYAAQYQTDDVIITDVRLIDSEVNGQDVCFIIDLECNHSNTALQFSHLNEVMINLCQAMSHRDHFDCVSFTVFDKFVDKYGNTQRIVSITAVYKVPTLRIINYDYHMSYKYSKPTAFISCADSYYIHPGYDLK